MSKSQARETRMPRDHTRQSAAAIHSRSPPHPMHVSRLRYSNTLLYKQARGESIDPQFPSRHPLHHLMKRHLGSSSPFNPPAPPTTPSPGTSASFFLFSRDKYHHVSSVREALINVYASATECPTM